jgi:hypothetical protein
VRPNQHPGNDQPDDAGHVQALEQHRRQEDNKQDQRKNQHRIRQRQIQFVVQMAEEFTHDKIVWMAAGWAAIKDSCFFSTGANLDARAKFFFLKKRR